ncbi:MAG: hypothetical protein HXX15_18170 [Rhodopseudomonas sp.]|nr:hypothetical protein [Rhodopseudomonas sp.]NVN88009.1 hypothetical protein [Rhodopseudomonas sp.]
MTLDLLLLAAALVSVIVIFAGVMIVGDFQDQPCHRELDPNRREPRLF